MELDRNLAKMKKIFSKQRCNAKLLGVQWNLSFEDWKEVWDLSGKWDKYGKGLDKFMMFRVDTTKPWELKNIKITTQHGIFN